MEERSRFFAYTRFVCRTPPLPRLTTTLFLKAGLKEFSILLPLGACARVLFWKPNERQRELTAPPSIQFWLSKTKHEKKNGKPVCRSTHLLPASLVLESDAPDAGAAGKDGSIVHDRNIFGTPVDRCDGDRRDRFETSPTLIGRWEEVHHSKPPTTVRRWVWLAGLDG